MRAAVAADASFSNVPVTESFLPLRVASALPEPTIAAAFDVMPAPLEVSAGAGDKRTLYFVPLCAPADYCQSRETNSEQHRYDISFQRHVSSPRQDFWQLEYSECILPQRKL